MGQEKMEPVQVRGVIEGEWYLRLTRVEAFLRVKGVDLGERKRGIGRIVSQAVRDYVQRMEENSRDGTWKPSLSSENGTLHLVKSRVLSLAERDRTYLISILPDLIDALGGAHGSEVRDRIVAVLDLAKKAGREKSGELRKITESTLRKGGPHAGCR